VRSEHGEESEDGQMRRSLKGSAVSTRTYFPVLILLALLFAAAIFVDAYPGAAEVRDAGGLAPALLRDATRGASYGVAFVLVFSVFVDGSRWVRRMALAAAALGAVAFVVLFAGAPAGHAVQEGSFVIASSRLHRFVQMVGCMGAATSLVSIPWLVAGMVRSIHTHAPR